MKSKSTTLSTNWSDVVCRPTSRRVNVRATAESQRARQQFLERVADGEYDSEQGLKKATILFRSLDLIRSFEVVQLDSAACDSNAAPEPPTDEVLELLSQCSLDKFRAVTSSAMMEYIAVYEYFPSTRSVSPTPVHICYATIDKGAVSIPSEILEDDERRFIVTHNHPNCSALSPPDFMAFARYKSIRTLIAETIPYTYQFMRDDSPEVINEDVVEDYTSTVTAMSNNALDRISQTPRYADLREAINNGTTNTYLSCTEKGASLWAEITHNAWLEAMQDRDYHGFSYGRETKTEAAKGLFGTTNNDGLLILLRKYRQSRPIGDDVNADTAGLGERHKAPYRAEYFSPGYDVSQAFPGIYTMSFAQALREYGHGIDNDPEALQVIRNIHNKPDAKVKIYRAVRKGLHDNIADLKKEQKYIRNTRSTPPWADVPLNTRDDYSEYVDSQLENLRMVDGAKIQPSIGARDWVTITRKYAEDHGESALQGEYTIITKTVHAKDIFTDGNSIHEWGYDPEINDSSLEGVTYVPTDAPQKEVNSADTTNQSDLSAAAPLTTAEIVAMEPPEALPLTGELRDFLTNLLAKFNMLIWGGAGSGKSSFVLRLANELAETDTGRVLYYMTEEKVASGRLKARMDLMKAYSENINFDDAGTFDRLTALVNTGMYRYVIVDSINMINVEQSKIVELMQTFPEVSWIFIAQATKGKNAYAGVQALAHAVDTEIATSNDKGVGVAELRKHRDGPLKTHTIFGNKGMRDPAWKKSW